MPCARPWKKSWRCPRSRVGRERPALLRRQALPAAWVVMPNHVRALFTPVDGFALTGILHSWKSFTAKEGNRIVGQSGKFWQEEYFDRYMRNDRHYFASIEYIELNPVKARLCERKEDW